MHRSASTVALVAAVLVLAGCSAVAPTTPTPTAAGGDAAGEAIPDGADTQRATVTRVVDGDTIEVRAGGETDTVRLVGVDAPEARGETNPAEFEGVPDTAAGRACLARAADNATAALADLVADRDVTLAVDPLTDRRDRYDRLLAHVVVDGTNANHRLVETGRARVYDTEFALADRFYASERAAQDQRRGLWSCADQPTGGTGLQLRVRADAPGDDRENPNGEYVALVAGDDAVDVGGWTVSDEAGREFTFPEGTTVPANGSVRLYSGSGEDTATEFYWNEGAVWNNDGDTASVWNEDGDLVLEHSY
ncbi:thermonuclease family protein [Halomicrobium salinisoli]|uniref:thermonuclease family protein n=1 Tax=Halomicrobium salinisoli TaxID=2878391 RepID=UPI001CEFBE9F|nr:thermonuclease family protein [Halomicrobium salinisoli]